MNNPKKILVIQTAFLGDVIMTTPIFSALKEIYPDSEIHAMVIPPAVELLESNPNISKVIKFNKKVGLIKKFRNIINIISQSKKESYDLAVSIQHSFTSSIIMLLSGIPVRIGNRKMKFLTQKVYIPLGLHNRHRVLSLLLPLSTKSFSGDTELFFINEPLDDKFLLKNVNFHKIGISPGSVRKTKMWKEEYFSKLLDLLKNDDIDVYFYGSPQEKDLCERIISGSSNKNVTNTAGKLRLMESAEYIKEMDLMITNDSAPLHIADAVNTPVFAFFGPTVRKFGCYPYREHDKMLEVDLDCRPCHKHGDDTCPLGHHKCMVDIKPQYVYKLIKDHFKQNPK